MNLLNKLGYDLEFILIDSPKDIGIKELFNRINRISTKSNKSRHQKIKVLSDAIKVMNLIDKIEGRLDYLAGYEEEKG